MINEDDKEKTISALIIDDEYDICFLLSKILRAKKLNVKFVNSITEGKAMLKQNSPNLIFLDNHLPDGFGIDFISEIKKEHADTKIVMVTAHDSNEDRNKAIHQGADIFLSKPFSNKEIENVLLSLYP